MRPQNGGKYWEARSIFLWNLYLLAVNTVNVTRMCFFLVRDQDALKHPWCDLVYLTDIMADFDCDVFFPEFDRELFKVQERYVFISSQEIVVWPLLAEGVGPISKPSGVKVTV